ncbi:unnamed protein product, partial [Owenia fusiformis]
FQKGYQLQRHIMECHQYLTCGINGCAIKMLKKDSESMIRHRLNHQARDKYYQSKTQSKQNDVMFSPKVDLSKSWTVPEKPPRNLLDCEQSDTETVLYDETTYVHDPVDWSKLSS